MVVVSIKTKLKWVLAGIVVLICLAILVMAVSLNIRGEQWAIAADLKYSLTAGDSDERIAFLKQFGWDVEEEPVEVTEVVIPETFNSVYEQYNEIQKQQGLDLSKFGGVTCKKWVYQVTNYPKPGESVRATLLGSRWKSDWGRHQFGGVGWFHDQLFRGKHRSQGNRYSDF